MKVLQLIQCETLSPVNTHSRKHQQLPQAHMATFLSVDTFVVGGYGWPSSQGDQPHLFSEAC